MQKILKPKKITQTNVRGYGVLVEFDGKKANYHDPQWISKFPASKSFLNKAQFGWVKSKAENKVLKIEGMEREPEIEIVIPISSPLIHVMSKKTEKKQPSAQNAEAFIIYPGQSIIMNPGVWHYCSFPYKTSTTFYFFITKDHPREKGWENVAWIPFLEKKSIKVNLK